MKHISYGLSLVAALVAVSPLTALPALAAEPAVAVRPALASDPAPEAPPNIVYILCDDLGYGDVACFNPDGKISTPYIDQLASQGMRFIDMHSGSAVCSPTRYGLITGRYAWRSRLQHGVLGGLSPRLIEPARMTVASFLKEHAYRTACIGKWHLGMDWVKKPGKDVTELNIETAEQVHNVDYSQPIANGPNSVGFDEYFGISGSLDMVPYTFIENDHVTVLPVEEKSFPLMLGRPERTTRLGPAAPGFQASDVLPTLTQRAVDYIHSAAAAGQPFFLYLPLASPHTPIAPNAQWQGKSGLNPYGDFVMETDAAIGRVVSALDEAGLAENTLVIVTSDNGCSPQAKFNELLAKGHNPSHVFRGTKADVYEGGHRVPFVARWPARVKPGTTCDQTLCLTDLFATCADILNADLPPNAAEDSVSFLPALEGTADQPLREAVVHHSVNGSFAIRKGNWKLLLCPGSGGWSKPRPIADDTSKMPAVQLYDLASDIGEQRNVERDHPEIVHELVALLERYVAEGRSTPGPRQQNAVEVDVWKAGRDAHRPKRTTQPKATTSARSDRRPNVLFIITDDQREDTIAALGNPVIQTPHIDRLVRAGLVFENAYCMGSTVPAVCFPSRSMLLSGRSLFHVEQRPNATYEINMPKTFRQAGYETFHHGKQGNGPAGIYKDFEHAQYIADETAERLSGFPGRETAEAAIHFLASRDRSRPFFMYLGFGNPHDPRVVNHEYRARYIDSQMPLPANYAPLHPFDNGWLAGRDEQLAPWPRTEDEIRRHLADYYGVITYLDLQIGRILDALRESGEYDNTLIVFTSDHGLALGSHGLMGKQSLYEHSMNPPLVLVGPGIPQGRSEAFVYLYDLFPTLCDLTGVPVPPEIDGRSFAAVVRGEATTARDEIFLAYLDVQRAVRRGDWKLICYPKINRVQLFNVRDDPHELRDLASAEPERVQSLKTRLAELQTAYDDAAPLESDQPADATVTPEKLREQAKKMAPRRVPAK